jgi:hypothetical protein
VRRCSAGLGERAETKEKFTDARQHSAFRQIDLHWFAFRLGRRSLAPREP